MNLEITQYKDFIQDIKQKIQTSQIKAHIKVNVELLKLYWELGSMIVEKQKLSSWGDGLISDISKDLKKEFPNLKGFSKRNIELMRQWYKFWINDLSITKQLVSQIENTIFNIPWGHNIVIVTKSKSLKEANFYVNKIIENNYSRAVLVHQIETDLYNRSGKAITNFQGFSFVGRQYKLDVGGSEFKIDLLFYHIKLYCYVVVELKAVDFKPEFVGKLNFYTSAIDGEVKSERDNPTIGILICKSKNDTVVEYALKDIDKPLGVSEYKITDILPDNYKSSLPSIEQIEQELSNNINA